MRTYAHVKVAKTLRIPRTRSPDQSTLIRVQKKENKGKRERKKEIHIEKESGAGLKRTNAC